MLATRLHPDGLWRIDYAAGNGAPPLYYAPLEVVGLYWSFVDVVWLFLFPALYLPGRG